MSKVLKLLRQAKSEDPQAFEEAIRAYLEKGDSALKPASRGGRPRQLSRTTYALLLADVKARPDGMSEAEKLKELADKGVKWGRDMAHVSRWLNANTIKTHLKSAKRLAETDPGFAEDVEFFCWCFGRMNNS
jgi:transposase